MPRLTFINKTSSSGDVSRSTPAERRRINERNRQFRASNRTNQAVRLGPDQPLQFTPEPQSTTTPESRPVDHDSDITEQLTLSRSGNPVPSFSFSAAATIGNPYDPFHAVSTPMNSEVLALLRHYREACHNLMWDQINRTYRGRFDDVLVPHCTAESVILECMQNRTRMYALLANIACHLQRPEFNKLQMIQRGTAALRTDLIASQEAVTADILVSAINLYMASNAYEQPDAAQAHLSGAKAILRRLIEQRTPLPSIQLAVSAIVDVETSRQLLQTRPQESIAETPTSMRFPSAQSTEQP